MLRATDLKAGEPVIYVNGGEDGRYELGIVKRVVSDGAFVYYHEGETPAKTPFDKLHKLTNRHVIQDTTLGGEEGREIFLHAKERMFT